MRSILVVSFCVLGALSSIAGADDKPTNDGWLSLTRGEEGASIRVLVSADRKQVAEDWSTYSNMNGGARVATICDENKAQGECRSFWIEAGDGGEEEDAEPKYEAALAKGAFEVAPLRRSGAKHGTFGKLRFALRGDAVTIKRGNVVVARASLGGRPMHLVAVGAIRDAAVVVYYDAAGSHTVRVLRF